jgi:ubiquinone/menaquinone biosynthesis C-methylase UbiE
MMYQRFAMIYDRVMRGVDYDTWADYLLNLASKYGFDYSHLCDLACGTGSMAMVLAEKGCRVLGVDLSASMLERAKVKSKDYPEGSLRWREGDLTEFELEESFPLITCLYDSLNYLLSEEAVEACLKRVFRHLRPGGGFIFDVTTEYNIIANFADYTFAENLEDCSYIWENQYDLLNKIISSDVTLFYRDGDRFFKDVETHRQKIYSTPQIERMARAAGFEVLAAYDGITLNPPGPKSERVHFVCRKP